jgi:hypothetical protein
VTQDTLASYDKADVLQTRLGLTPMVGLKVAAIITFAGGIEFYLERALWRLRGINPKDIKPETDAKVISDLIGMLGKVAVECPREHGRSWTIGAPPRALDSSFVTISLMEFR